MILRSLVLTCVFLLIMGCGGASAKYYEAAEPEAPASEEAVAEEYLAEGELLYEGAPAGEMDVLYDLEDDGGPPEQDSFKNSSGYISQPSPGSTSNSTQVASNTAGTSTPPVAINTPKVVYRGYLHLRVKRLLETVDKIVESTEKRGGYIESLTSNVVVVRIPSSDFEKVMDYFSGFGDLLDKRINAADVTDRFTDLQGRLWVAKQARDRLLKLLEQVEDVKERLAILNEVKRLTEKIEGIESQLSVLQNLVDFFTITIELTPILKEGTVLHHVSPFNWVRELRPHITTVSEEPDEIRFELPNYFVLFDDEDLYLAQSADTTTIRVGIVENEPLGNNEFWIDAVHFEFENRDEQLVDSNDEGSVFYRVYVSKDLNPRYYLVGVHVHEDEIYVIEVFYPNEDSFKRYNENVKKAISTFKVL